MIKNHCINPVDSREASDEKPETLVTVFDEPDDIRILDGFREMEIYKTVLKELNSKDYRNAKNEVKMKVLVNVKDIQTEVDKLTKAYNDIDVMIQSTNWNVDLE